MKQVQPSPEESPSRYMLPHQSSEEKFTSMIDYSYNPYSPAKYPTVGQKRKRMNKKAEKKPKTKKIKQETEGKTFNKLS